MGEEIELILNRLVAAAAGRYNENLRLREAQEGYLPIFSDNLPVHFARDLDFFYSRAITVTPFPFPSQVQQSFHYQFSSMHYMVNHAWEIMQLPSGIWGVTYTEGNQAQEVFMGPEVFRKEAVGLNKSQIYQFREASIVTRYSRRLEKSHMERLKKSFEDILR